MSLPPSSLGKSLTSPPPLPPPSSSSHSSVGPTPASSSGFEHASRRPSSLSGSSVLSATASPRKGQGARKQHRNQKRPNGSNSNSNSYRRPDEDDAMAEARALRNTSSRRGQTSITHLLNYAAPSRVYLDQVYGSRQSSYRGSHYGHQGHGHGHHGTIDKARFVHANYRFVVSPTGDYTRQAADADEYLDWADVLQILASAESQSSACPICLSEPVAPRMARCGHIFCLACLIRFMHATTEDTNTASGGQSARSSGRAASSVPGHPDHNAAAAATTNRPERRARWKKCPICEDSIYLAEVRPVRFYAGQECPLPHPGDDVVLRLMMRHANSTVALPRESGSDVLNAGILDTAEGGSGGSRGDGIPWHFAANVLDYARIMRGTGDYMVEQFEHEVQEVTRQETEDELLFHEDGEWSQWAIRTVRAAQEKARELGGLEAALSGTGTATARAADKPPAAASLRPEDGDPHSQQSQQQDFFFYSAPPHLYLSPLDIRILKTKYGAFSNFPSTLLPRVEHLSAGHVVDDAMRRRAKYLGHLPAGCVVSFLECDWTDIVPADILDAFAEDIERRRKRNRDKAAQEERERLQAERLELAAARSIRRGGGGERGGGAHGFADEDDLVSGFGAAAVDLNDFLPLGEQTASAASGSPPNPRPGFAHLANMGTSPTSGSGRTVWGTPAVVASSSDVLDSARAIQAPGDVDDGWLRDEQLLGPLSDGELALQLAALGVKDGGAGGAGGAGDSERRAEAGRTAPASSGKKKKKQKITLMSTGGRRGL